jgi:hypothetical protein
MNDDYLNYGNPAYDADYEFECPECGTEVEKEHQHCSRDCFKASMI